MFWGEIGFLIRVWILWKNKIGYFFLKLMVLWLENEFVYFWWYMMVINIYIYFMFIGVVFSF